jgi:Cd2+/Zn2+-exporting ATPase
MDRNLLTDLADLGFTEYEARVYLTLLSHHPLSGYQISVRSAVPRSMVYEALSRLEARGAVLRAGDTRGSVYRPVPPSTLLTHMEQTFHRRLTSLESRLGRQFRAAEDDRFWTGRGTELVLGLAEDMLSTAAAELLVVMADPEVDRYTPLLEAACRRGVRLGSVLTGQARVPCGLSVPHPPGESEIQRLERLLLIVSDAERVLIADLRGEASITQTTNSLMVHIARQFIWMELLTQHGAPDLLALLPAETRSFLVASAALAPTLTPTVAGSPPRPAAHPAARTRKRGARS